MSEEYEIVDFVTANQLAGEPCRNCGNIIDEGSLYYLERDLSGGPSALCKDCGDEKYGGPAKAKLAAANNAEKSGDGE